MTVALLAPPAERDLRKLRGSPDLERIRDAIRALEHGDEGLDVVPLEGRRPWRRFREGDWRIMFRPLSPAEARRLGIADGDAILVACIVNRRDLERAIRTL